MPAPVELSIVQPNLGPEPPLIYQPPLTRKTREGVLLRCDFSVQPHPAPTGALSHGYRASRTQLRPVAAIEYNLGYNVLLFDFRGHGASDSIITSGGHDEVRDLDAAITAASMQKETLPNTIILHGFSMGAAIALLT